MRMKCSDEWFVFKFPQIDTPVKRRPRFWQVIASVILLSSLGCGKSEQPQARPPEVEVVQVEQKDVPIPNEWVGTLEGLVNAQIRPQVTGYLLRRTYQEGSLVKKGQLLFEIDPRTFQAALDQTKAQLANAEQQLAQAEANQVKAQLDVDRYIPLAKEQAVTQQALDNAVQTNLAAQAASPGSQSSNRCGESPGGCGSAQSELYENRLADRRHCRHRSSADWRPRNADQFANDCVHG